jgi:predicted dehydrogenase
MADSMRLTRRRFLRGAGATLAVAPWLTPTTAVGQGAVAAASARVTLGFIGVGGMGRGNLGAFLGFGDVQVVAVCDVDESSCAAACADVEKHYAAQKESGAWQGCTPYRDFRELLARPDLDAVCIATPDHWHAIIAIEAAKNGKDIYCEKPLSLTIGEARAMVTAVRRYGRVLQTGSQQRSSPEFRFACEMVRSGRIGKLVTINVNVGGPSGDCYLPAEPVPLGLDWDMWLGPAPWRPFHSRLHPFNWRSFRDYSGGGMTDWGAHHFDIAQWAMDMDHSGPLEILPPAGKERSKLTYVYANGVTVTHGDGSDGVLFTGTDGKIEVNRGHLRTWPDELQRTPTQPGEVHLYNSRDHRADFLDCVRSRQRPVCDVEIGCRSVTVCHLGNLAYWLKRPLRWDPAREELVGDAEASRWLDRPRRAPWRLA